MTLKDAVAYATIREVDHRNPTDVAKWREAEAAALRAVLSALRNERGES